MRCLRVPRRRGRSGVAVVLWACMLASACSSQPVARPATQRGLAPPSPLPTAQAPPVAPAVRREVFGYSVRGVALVALVRGPETATHRILVVGCVHGDECAGVPVARQVATSTPPLGVEVVVVPELNPDGHAAGTRQNAHGVDLNRNFPWQWARIGRPGDQQYSGTGPLSEPESRAMAGLIRRVRPTVTVWFHQPVGVVDLSGGSVAVERRFAHVAGLPVQQLTRYAGSASSWQNSLRPGSTTAFVVELSRPAPTDQLAGALAAVLDLES